MAFNIRLLLTSGDPDGIGWEVSVKALNQLGPQTGVQFFLFRQSGTTLRRPALSRAFRRVTVRSLAEAENVKFDPRLLVEVLSKDSPAHWVESAAKACLSGRFQGLVTAPLSKTSIIEAGFKDIGHTEILARVCGISDLFMGFIGRKFSVLLATGHQPLRRALADLSPARLTKAFCAAERLRSVLPRAKRGRPLALVGVNPHAGEEGLLGDEEDHFRDVLANLRWGEDQVIGPLVPDAAFLPKFWTRFSVYVCPYHDQGLIPFKLVHGFKAGVHLTLGLPFVRTSVDHGTAKDLFGKNKAESGSMRDALLTAIRLCKEKKHEDLAGHFPRV
ncbi:MAG: PdxA family protein [Bdellovibrionales bacterium]